MSTSTALGPHRALSTLLMSVAHTYVNQTADVKQKTMHYDGKQVNALSPRNTGHDTRILRNTIVQGHVRTLGHEGAHCTRPVVTKNLSPSLFLAALPIVGKRSMQNGREL